MITYKYEAGELHDDLYDLRLEMERLEKVLNSNKIRKADRQLLLSALEIISKLEK